MSLTAYERETIVNYNDGEDFATIYTASKFTMAKCEKLGYKIIEKCTKGGEVVAVTFKCPKNLISFRKKREKKVLTEEQKKAFLDRMNAVRENKA